MESPGKEHTLKDGALLLIRSLDEADAPVMLDYLSTVFGETCNLSRSTPRHGGRPPVSPWRPTGFLSAPGAAAFSGCSSGGLP